MDTSVERMTPFSAAFAVSDIARRSGSPIDFDALIVAMGLPWLDCSVAAEPNPGLWPMYARDAFLVPACRLFGLLLRDIHPPEAARGLPGTPEFEQHFEASYRPLILRALEHGQPVLAWQGWPADHRLHWGLIDRSAKPGIGLTGRVFLSGDDDGVPCPLEQPAVQVYVVEAFQPITPPAEALWSRIRRHALLLLREGLHERFGVITGPLAYDRWIAIADGAVSDPAREGAGRTLAALCKSSAVAHDVAVRFAGAAVGQLRGPKRERVCALRDRCREIAALMNNLANTDRTVAFLETSDGRAYVSSLLRTAKAASEAMRQALIA